MEKILNKILAGEPAYRLKQIKGVLFQDLIGDWSQAQVLPLELRERLNKEFPVSIQGDIAAFKSKDNLKVLIILKDGLKIESVLMRHNDGRNTVCVSSQVGCPLGCLFCATGKIGFKRNLDAWEIVQQVLFFARLLKKENKKVSNVVFMGMGEPFLNYDNVLSAIRILNDKEGLNIGARHLSISTAGLIEGIERLAKENLEINLAISLHAPTDGLRGRLMPVAKKYSLQKILAAVDNYLAITRRRVMFEYVMIKDFNDSLPQARALARLMKKPLYFVNLISFNATGDLKPSSRETIKKFKEVLEKEGVFVTQRYRFGQDIKAACGQLVYEHGK